MEIVFTSILAFVSTNIDDLFLLTLFFGNRRFRTSAIVIGQILGIVALIAISLIGSMIGYLVHLHFIGLLGFVPIYLGIRGLRQKTAGDVEGTSESNNAIANTTGALAVAGVTIANGGDNVGVYIPLFSGLNWIGKSTMIVIFLMMTLVWCMTARYLTKHPYVAKNIDRYGHSFTPFILVGLGFYIFYETGLFSIVSNWLF